MKIHNFIPKTAKITEKRPLTENIVGLRLEISKNTPFHFHPGQFVMLSVLGFGEIPIGITTSPDEKGFFEVAVSSVGMVSQKICSLPVKDKIGVNGPFGNGFPISKIKGKNIVLIAGGFGLAPLRSLIHTAKKDKSLFKSIKILTGARNPDLLLYKDEYKEWGEFAEVYTTVDECNSSWKGCVGNITKLFDRANINTGSVVIICGPPPMFKPIINRFAGKRVAESDLYLLLERRMKCGIGKCQHCTCGELYACLDGPVFSYDQLKYNEEAFK